jgi:hypothetical protein
MSLAQSPRRRPVRLAVITLAITGGLTTLVAARTPARPVAPAAGGLTFTYTVTSTSGDKRVKEAKDMVATVRLQSGNARMDFTAGKGPMGQKGAYILITSSPAQFSIVNDKEKQVMVMDAAQFGSGMGAMMNNPMMKMTISNAKWSFKDLGAGDAIQGYQTRHVRIYSGSDVEIKILGMTQRSSSNDSSDQWIAQSVEVDADAMAAFGKSFTSGVKSTNPEMAAEFVKYEREYGRSGLALRSKTWSTVTDGKGKVTADTITMEVTELKKGAIDAAMFKLPEGYEVMNISESMKAMSSAMDSAKKANGESDKDKEKSKEREKVNTPGDLIKAGIGGMFKKKPPKDTLS